MDQGGFRLFLHCLPDVHAGNRIVPVAGAGKELVEDGSRKDRGKAVEFRFLPWLSWLSWLSLAQLLCSLAHLSGVFVDELNCFFEASSPGACRDCKRGCALQEASYLCRADWSLATGVWLRARIGPLLIGSGC